MSDAIAGLLAWFYELIPNYGLSIILLTLVVMLVLTPLTMKGTRSMMAMQRFQPEMKKLQEKYKDDRQKLNEEMMRFYKENQINPVAGCLPLFVQLPVFIILFRVLQGLTMKESQLGSTLGWVAGHLSSGQVAPALPEVVRTFDPGYLDHGSALYEDLAGSTAMNSFGLDLALSPLQALESGIGTALPYLLMVVVVAATSWYQQQQIMARNDKRGVKTDPNMAFMTKVMPMMLPVFSVGMPTGLVVYFLVSNLYRVGQQGWITRTMDHELGSAKAGSAVVETTAKETGKADKAGKSDKSDKAVTESSDESDASVTRPPSARGGEGSRRIGGGGAGGGPKKKRKK